VSTFLAAILSWRIFVIAIAAFGFAPGAVLRLILLAFPKDDPRRKELLAEVYVVPRLERPFWVAQQLEVAIFEGLRERIEWAATGRIVHRWNLISGVERNREYPDTFEIPDEVERTSVLPGDFVKVAFEMKDGWGERMWVEVTKVTRRRVIGTLSNQPIGIPRLWFGDKIRLRPENIIDIDFFDIEGESDSGAMAS
jgi:hypothetical protein